MIVVTGATGQLGRQVVAHLLDRLPATEVGVSVRDPAKAADLTARGVRVREGDFARPDTLAHAFEGAAQLLLISSNAAAYGGDTLAQHRAAIDAARAAGVGRIVYTSHMGASATSAFPPMHHHAATEAMLAASGLPWTALRNGFYAASGIQLMGDAATTGVIEAPVDGPVAWTAHADLAEAAALILTQQAPADGPTAPLTGEHALDLADMAHVLSGIIGRPVERRVITDDALTARMAARGAPPAVAAISIGLYRAAHAGEFARVDPTLAHLLGRAPTTLRDVIAAKLAGA